MLADPQVSLKTLGLAALMAKAGLRVLAEPAADGLPVAVPHFDLVMADIGDDQSIVPPALCGVLRAFLVVLRFFTAFFVPPRRGRATLWRRAVLFGGLSIAP